MKTLFALTSASVLCLASTAYAGDKASPLDGFNKTDEVTTCLPLRQVKSIKSAGKKKFLVSANGGRFYLNETSGNCSGAGKPFTYLQYKTSMNSLCKGEIIRVIDNSGGFTVGSCSLGKFTKLEKKEAAE